MTETKITNYVDTQTGEVVAYESEKTFITKTTQDKFYMTFIDYIAPYHQLKSDAAKSVLVFMCSNAEWNTGKVYFTKNVRQECCDVCNVSATNLSNLLKKLKDLKLIDGSRDEFTINPQIFWKGDTKERKNLIKIKEIQTTFNIIAE